MDLSIPLFLNLAYAYVLASKLIKCSNIEYSLSKGSGYTRSHQTLPLCVGFTLPSMRHLVLRMLAPTFVSTLVQWKLSLIFSIILRWLPKSSPPPLLYIIQFSLNSGLYLQATPVLVGNGCTTYSL
jgi:hypothetical protein